MKLMKLNPRRNQSGNTLLFTLCVVLLLAITIVSLETLSSNQYFATKHSEDWNAALAISEAGVEDALTHINTYGLSNMVAGVPLLNANGWTLSGTNYVKDFTLDESSYYHVAITPTANPTITSTGYFRQPLGTNYLSRKVQVTTSLYGNWPRGMFLRSGIIVGNNFTADSYDSQDPMYSTGGLYDIKKHKDTVNVGVNHGSLNISLGKADIYGNFFTAPSDKISFLKGGSVGSTAWVDANNTGAQPGHLRSDLSIAFPDVPVPWTGGAMAPCCGDKTYSYTFTTGNWQVTGDWTVNKNPILISGDVALYITGQVTFNNGADVIIQPGSRLTLYVGGAQAKLYGNVINQSGDATRFIYYGLPGNTQIAFNGSGDICGVIYAPRATFAFSGSAGLYGSVIADVAKWGGNADYHYDENVSKGAPTKFLVSSWTEL